MTLPPYRNYLNLGLIVPMSISRRRRETTPLNLVLRILVASLCLSAGFELPAATYYVSTSGADTNAGSQTLPWRTIQKAANTMVAGDTVLVQPGIYAEKVSAGASGTAGNFITYRAQGAVTNHGWFINNSYLTVDGFDVVDGNAGLVPNYDGAILVYRGNTHVNLINNHIHDWNVTNMVFGVLLYYAASSSAASSFITISNNTFLNGSAVSCLINGSNVVVSGNTFGFNNTHDSIQFWGNYIWITNNLFTNVSRNLLVPDHTDLFQTFGNDGGTIECSNVWIVNNLAVNCEAQISSFEKHGRNFGGWHFYNNIFDHVYYQANIDVESEWCNNLFYYCTTNTGNPLVFGGDANHAGAAEGSRVYNNIFAYCGADPANTQFGWYDGGVETGGLTNFMADYNMVIRAGNGAAQTAPPDDRFRWKSWGWETHGINGGDPKFANVGLLNFRLRAGSPLLDKATPISSFSVAIDGTQRPQGIAWDIGPYEGAVGPLPAGPSNLRVNQP